MKQYLLLLLLLGYVSAISQNTQRSSLGMAGSTVVIQNKYVSSSVGQQSVTGTSIGETAVLRQGFQQPFIQLVAIPDVLNDLEIIVFPNPVKASLSIKLNEEISSPMEVSIYNVLGQQVVFQKQKPQPLTTLDLSKLSSGNYILAVLIGKQSFTSKIIKN